MIGPLQAAHSFGGITQLTFHGKISQIFSRPLLRSSILKQKALIINEVLMACKDAEKYCKFQLTIRLLRIAQLTTVIKIVLLKLQCNPELLRSSSFCARRHPPLCPLLRAFVITF